MRRLDFLIGAGEAGRLVGRLAVSWCGLSHGEYARLKQTGGVLLDERQAFANERVQEGQTLTFLLSIDEEKGKTAQKPSCIAYEDEDILIVDKPAPLSSMRSAHQAGETLEDIIGAYVGCYRPVNRLDKGTSGLMTTAKTAYAQNTLQRQLHTQSFIREYLAVVDGQLPKTEGTVTFPIAKEDEQGVRRVISAAGRPCVTHYRVLNHQNGRSLVKIRLETGRTHQIRVHMQALNCPVTGDYLYGTPCPSLPGRFALHSAHIELTHPVTQKTLVFDSPLPQNLCDLLKCRGND